MVSDGNDGVLLTGATGFLGSALLHELVETGRPIFATVRPQSKLDRIAALTDRPNLRLISSEPYALEAAFAHRSIGTIIHTATEYGRNGTPIADILNANLIFPVRLAELGVKYGTMAFINIDTFFNKFEYNHSNLANYSISKMNLLKWLEIFSSKIKVINSVMEHLYGPYDSKYKFIEYMIKNIAIFRTKSVDITHGHQKRDFIYISDAVSAIMKIFENIQNINSNFKSIGIGTGEGMQVRDMVSLIATHSGSPTELRFGAIPYRPDEIMSSHAEVRDLKDLGWRAKVTPTEGVRMILSRYDESGVL